MKDFADINEAGEVLSENAICICVEKNIEKIKGLVDFSRNIVFIGNANYPNDTPLACCEGIVSVKSDKTHPIHEGDVLYLGLKNMVTSTVNNNQCGIAMSDTKIDKDGDEIVSMLIDFVKMKGN